MSPLADAMRFVNRDQIELPLSQVSEKARQHCPLRRHIQEPILSMAQTQHSLRSFIRLQRGIKKRRRNPAGLKRINLILHQRDQRRHHYRQAVPRQRRQLKTEGLASARRQQCDNIPPRQSIANDLFLQRPKGIEAERLLE